MQDSRYHHIISAQEPQHQFNSQQKKSKTEQKKAGEKG